MDTVKSKQNAKTRFESYDCSEGCPVEAALEQISGKWKGLVLYHLIDETYRFNELMQKVGNVTQRSLTKQLRELERDGLVHRKVYAVVPPKVEYRLTEKGQKLKPVLEALHHWGSENVLSR